MPANTPKRSPLAASAVGKLVSHFGRAWRFLLVTAINNVNHQGLLYLANSIWGWPGGQANMFAGLVAAVPAYLLSRWWVWNVRGKRHDLRREVLPFVAIAAVGLIVSTVFAEFADRWFGAGLVVNFATLLAYFLVWLGKYALLDRVFATENGPRAEGTS